MGLVVNFNLFQSGTLVDKLAGRAGWWNLSDNDAQAGIYHLILSLIPTAVLTMVAFYLCIMMWNEYCDCYIPTNSKLYISPQVWLFQCIFACSILTTFLIDMKHSLPWLCIPPSASKWCCLIHGVFPFDR